MTHAEARKIIEAAWQKVWGRAPSANEALYAQAIAFLETGYGRAGQFAKYAASGQYNWGNIEKHRTGDTCPDGWVPGDDQGPVCFRAFPSDVDAAAYFISVLTKGHWPVAQAMAGSPEDVARAMRVPPAYYAGRSTDSEEGKVTYYASAIRNAIKAIGAEPPSAAASGGSFGLFGLSVLALGGYAAWAWYTGRPFVPSSLRRLTGF